eukprot:jgi/Botrbrau1/19756/Bobra.0124s0009.1
MRMRCCTTTLATCITTLWWISLSKGELQSGAQQVKHEGVDHSLDTTVTASCDSPQLTYEGDPVHFSVQVSAKPTNESGPPLFSVAHCFVVFNINDKDTKPIPLKKSGKDDDSGAAVYSAENLPTGIATVIVRVLPFQLKDIQTGDIWGFRSSSSPKILHVVMPKPEPPPPMGTLPEKQ